MGNKDRYEGKIFNTNTSGKLKVLEYRNNRDCTVEFIDTGNIINGVQLVKIVRGEIKDRMRPTLYGVGFIGNGEYKSCGIHLRCYQTWSGMIGRCYNKNSVNYERYGGAGVRVCEEWHNYQNFAQWYFCNIPSEDGSYQVDKDMKGRELKLYSPESCLFVTIQENNEESHAKEFNVIDPLGNHISGFNLSKFCRENGLTTANMQKVINGQRRMHKGWTA